MKYGKKLVGIVEMYKDVLAIYKTKHMPKYLTIEDKKFKVKVRIQNQRIKIYVTKEVDLVNNIVSVHSKILGQCTEPLQNIIKHLD